MTYSIVGFNTTNNNITLLLADGTQKNFVLPVVDGLVPEGSNLTTLLDTYVANIGVIQSSDPVAKNGAVIQALVTALPTNVVAKQVRQIRNGLLRQSDFSQLADVTVDKTVWATYRQALRDLPSQKDFPNIEMPTKPL